MLCGGLGLLLGELVAKEVPRLYWSLAAGLVSLLGVLGMALGLGKMHFKDAFFSMTPERISYRLTLYGPERTLYWSNIDSIQVSEHSLLFELKDGNQVTMRLGNIQCPQTANHVSVSIQLAAVSQQIEVNQSTPASRQVT